MDLPVVEHYSIRLDIHGKYVAEVGTRYALSLVNSRNANAIEFHVDDPDLLPRQKGHCQHTGSAVTSVQTGTKSTNEPPTNIEMATQKTRAILQLESRVSKAWAKRILTSTALRTQWGNAVMAFSALKAAKLMLKNRHINVVVRMYGASLILQPKIAQYGIGLEDDVDVEILPCGSAYIHTGGNVEGKPIENEAPSSRTKCWELCVRECELSGVKLSRVFIDENSTKECSHGASATRMLYTLSKELGNMTGGYKPSETTVIQVARDTDNVCLALLAADTRGLHEAQDVFVKVEHGHYNIRALISSVISAGMCPEAIARLYALSGHDYQPSCAVATGRSMARVYTALSDEIGDLRTKESCLSLFYYTFASTLHGGGASKLPSQLNNYAAMSAAWKFEVRKFILFHESTKTASALLPQEEDLVLAHLRGNRFTIEAFWIKASTTRNLKELPYGVEYGTEDTGYPLLEAQGSIEIREKVIKARRRRCSCGKTNEKMCCVPPGQGERASQCGCIKANRICLSSCECDAVRYANRIGGVAGASQRMEKRGICRGNSANRASRRQAAPIASLLNLEDSSPGNTASSHRPLVDVENLENPSDTDEHY